MLQAEIQEKFEQLREILTDTQIVDSILCQFSSDQLTSLFEDLCWEHDIQLDEEEEE